MGSGAAPIRGAWCSPAPSGAEGAGDAGPATQLRRRRLRASPEPRAAPGTRPAPLNLGAAAGAVAGSALGLLAPRLPRARPRSEPARRARLAATRYPSPLSAPTPALPACRRPVPPAPPPHPPRPRPPRAPPPRCPGGHPLPLVGPGPVPHSPAPHRPPHPPK